MTNFSIAFGLQDNSPRDNSPADNSPRDNLANGQFAHKYCFYVKIYKFMDYRPKNIIHYVQISSIMKIG